MCIGGSTTWSDLATDSIDSYPAQLEYYLKEKGYNVNVINAGVPYHTSLDMLMSFITKGIYYNPDMLLIHTGLNDNGPAQSPFDYKPDYSHWRPVGYANNRNFINLWNKYPFSISRLMIIFYLDFEPSPTISMQTSSVPIELVSGTLITRERTIGLKNYFSSILFIAKKNNIIPVTLLINNDQSRKNSYAKKFIHEKNLNYAIERDKDITLLNNSIMDSISIANKVNVIPFDKFQPSSREYWYDNCHLTEEGIKEKAAFIGEHLINNFTMQTK
tara:strand:- start:465 stop:1283 length:819 start_codon:yes stop_codon:yes gene_type:complete